MTWRSPISLAQLRRAWRVVAFALPLAGILMSIGYLALPTDTPPACAQLVVAQMVSDQPVKGSFECLSGRLALVADRLGVTDDQSFADQIGTKGKALYRGRTNDGGYAFEVDYDGGSWVHVLYVANGKAVNLR